MRCERVGVMFCEGPTAGYMSGGRHVELGLALAFKDIETWIVGDPENVFHHLSEVDRFASWQDALAELGERT